MNNGCICCTVRGDLVRILGELADRRGKGELAFERVIIETTGLADPGPVAQTFFIDDEIAEYYLLDASSPWSTPSTRRSSSTSTGGAGAGRASPTAS